MISSVKLQQLQPYTIVTQIVFFFVCYWSCLNKNGPSASFQEIHAAFLITFLSKFVTVL